MHNLRAITKVAIRGSLASMIALGLTAASSWSAQAAWKPTGPVQIMVHTKPGSSPDVVARTVQKIWK